MSSKMQKRRTQAERRAETRQALLDSATRLFGAKGYADTSIEEIAADCEMTIGPIYHYFGNKKSLFAAVNELMEERILAIMDLRTSTGPGADLLTNWRNFLDLCDDPAFRRIVLIDGLNILGRERWTTSKVRKKASSSLGREGKVETAEQYRRALSSRALIGTFTEVSLMIAEADNTELAHREAEKLILSLFSGLKEFIHDENNE